MSEREKDRETTTGVSQMEWNGFKMVRKKASGVCFAHEIFYYNAFEDVVLTIV